MKKGLSIDDNKETTPVLRTVMSVVLCTAILITTLFFVGCSDVFAENPDVKNIKEGGGELNLSKFDNHLEPEDELTTGGSTKSIDSGDQQIFDSFISRVQASSSLTYTRAFSYSNNPPPNTNSLSTFLSGTSITAAEQGDKVYMRDQNTGTSLIYDGSVGNLIITDGTSEIVEFGNKEKRHTLNFLANEARLEIVSSEHEVVEGVEYVVINLNENSQISKWYFDSSGTLSLRMYLEREDVFAIRYYNIEFDVPLEPTVFQMGDSTQLSETPEIKIAQTPAQAEPEPAPEQPVVAQEPKEAEIKVNEPAEVVKEKEPEETPQEETPITPKEETPQTLAKGAVVPGVKKEEISEPKKADASKIVEYDPQKVAASKVPEEVDYPTDVLPLLGSFNITSADDTTKNGVRKITLSGNYTTSASTAYSFYKDILQGSSGFSSNESVNEETGNYRYNLIGKNAGWSIYITIEENGETGIKSLNISLTK